MDLEVQFYVAKYDKANDTFTWRSLEGTTNGDSVRYRSFTGLEDKGNIKNSYTETYADSDIVRADIPSSVTREAPTLALDVVIIRGGRVQTSTADDLSAYFSNGVTIYWDTQRMRCAVMLLNKEVTPEKDTYLTNAPYFEVKYEFTNLAGSCPIIADEYANDHLPLVEAYARQILSVALN